MPRSLTPPPAVCNLPASCPSTLESSHFPLFVCCNAVIAEVVLKSLDPRGPPPGGYPQRLCGPPARGGVSAFFSGRSAGLQKVGAQELTLRCVAAFLFAHDSVTRPIHRWAPVWGLPMPQVGRIGLRRCRSIFWGRRGPPTHKPSPPAADDSYTPLPLDHAIA